MKLFKFLAPMLGVAAMMVFVGCGGPKDEAANIPTVERADGPKYEEKPKQTADGFAVPENVVLEGAELKPDVAK